MVLAPEHELVEAITTPGMRAEVEAYREATSRRSERDRLAETKRVSGAFTGAYALNPFSGQQIPVYISEYVLAGYGTGAIMAVPGHDERDHRFAKHFNLPIVQVVQGPVGIDVQAEAYETKDETATIIHSGSLNGLTVPDAIERVITEVEERGIGKGSTQYRLRDAIFSRQRYWGAPIPIVYDAASGLPKPVSESELPVLLPHLDDFTPTGTGESPLAKATEWVHEHPGGRRETDTMPGWACSSWYFLRYADNQNQTEFASPKALAYWLPVDFYLGGAEHAVGHLLYARFWTKVLFDLGHCPVDEPFRKLVNQGMIQGMSALAYRHKQTGVYHSADTLTNLEEFTPIHVDVNLVEAGCLDVEATRNWLPQFETAQFILNAQGEFRVGSQVEKMSKRYHNVVNPDDVCSKYGADTFRMYEMFLGPLEQHKPWSTDGITGVHNFLKRFWGLFYDREGNWAVTQDEPSREELRVLHTAIKKVTEDIEGLSLNTAVSAFMICINELQRLGCRKRGVLSPLVVLLSPFAPHICEELWADLGNTDTVLSAAWPQWDAAMLARDVVNYPLQVNGKVRAQLELPAGLSPAEIEAEVLKGEELQKWLDGKPIKKVVVVPGRIVNVVVG
jgi:leucyl-tRNA synthetase